MAWDWGSGLSTATQGASTGAMLGSVFGPAGTLIGTGLGGLGGLLYGGFQGGQELEQFEENKRQQEELLNNQVAASEANRAAMRRLYNQQTGAQQSNIAQKYAQQQSGLMGGLAARGMLGSGAEAASRGAMAGQRAGDLAAAQTTGQANIAAADMTARNQAMQYAQQALTNRMANEQALNQRNQALMQNATQSLGGLGVAAIQNPMLAANLGGAGNIVSQALNPYVQDTMKGLGTLFNPGTQEVTTPNLNNMQLQRTQLQNPMATTASPLAPVNRTTQGLQELLGPQDTRQFQGVPMAQSDDQFIQNTRQYLMGNTQAQGLPQPLGYQAQGMTTDWLKQMQGMSPDQFKNNYDILNRRRGVGNELVANRYLTAYEALNPGFKLDRVSR
jgi:hypothetical protein